MLKYILIIAALMLIANTAQAYNILPKDWDATDTVLEALVITSLAIDRGQTDTIHRMRMEEVGWARTFIGSHPTHRQVNQYFATCAVVHTAIAIVLPTPYRELWQSVWIGIEVGTIHANNQIGIGIKF